MSGSIKILLIEDNPGDARLIREMLSEAGTRYDLECVDRLLKGLERLDSGGIDLVMLDLGLPDSQGFDTFSKISKHASKLPIVVLTGLDDETIGNKTIQDGSQDYLIKGQVDSHSLVRSIRYAIERKKAEEELASSKEFLNSVIEQDPTSLWISDSEGTLVKQNQACHELFGATDEEAVGKYNIFKDNIVKEQGLMPLVENVFEKGETARFTLDYDLSNVKHVKVKGATHRILDVVVSPIKDMHGKTTNAIVQHRDITKRKKAEEELQRYTEHLEEMVEERTRELKKAERMAAIGETASMVGHDLRNPLQAMVTTIYSVKKKLERVEKEGLDMQLEMIEDQVKYMDKIISDLQDYARPIEAKLVETSISQLIDEIVSSIKVPENVKVFLAIDEGLSVMIDPVLMRRVVTNLINNALQAMPKGGELKIRASKTKETASIIIQDTGEGITKKGMDKLFHPLYTTKAKGMGLGLPVCKRLVEAHGGNITVESKVDKGSIFTVEIPLNKKSLGGR